ncbi:MAG: hypothetical protein AAF580_00935 [Pseudomonadota bacterium]
MFGATQSPLVEKLVVGEHHIEVCSRSDPDKRREDLIRAIGYDLVHVMFPNTTGGTEIGLNLQRALCDPLELPKDVDSGPERLKIVGDLTLDWVPIRVEADFSLQDYKGTATVRKRDEDAKA